MRWALLLFLTLGMHGMYQRQDMTVIEVAHGVVTLESDGTCYTIDEAEAWRVGDRAEAIVSGGKIVEIRYGGRRNER